MWIRSVEEAGGLSRHAGEEFVYVMEGVLILASEFYEPLRLQAGDSVYFDSHMGHAYLAEGENPVRILVVNTTEPAVPPRRPPHGRRTIAYHLDCRGASGESLRDHGRSCEAASLVFRHLGN